MQSRVLCCHPREQRKLLEKCAATALNSKLIAGQKDFFSKIVVDAVMMLDELLPLKMIGVKKVQGGALEVRNGLEICSLALFTRHTNQIWFPPLNSIHFLLLRTLNLWLEWHSKRHSLMPALRCSPSAMWT